MQRLVLPMLALLVASCGPAQDSEAWREAAFQRAMTAATREARAQLPYFWEHQAAPAETEFDFLLKVALTDESGAEELVWVDQVTREGEAVTGQLASTPASPGDLEKGDVVSFTDDMIADWAFFSGERLLGHYTTRVMLPRLPADQADAMRSMLGENPV
ncbi:MAG: DUF2314 domain-containing protein [Alphaproteobacteria bacterium]|nr:DUF2314 domain-containing protein [Alphaproteobacteria bacterium]